MASVTYGKCIMANLIMAKVYMANETEPWRCRVMGIHRGRRTELSGYYTYSYSTIYRELYLHLRPYWLSITDRRSVQTDNSGWRRDLKDSRRGDLLYSRHDWAIRRVMDHWRSSRKLLLTDCSNTGGCRNGGPRFGTRRTPEGLSWTRDSSNTTFSPRIPLSPWSSLNSWTVDLFSRKRPEEIERCSTRVEIKSEAFALTLNIGGTNGWLWYL